LANKRHFKFSASLGNQSGFTLLEVIIALAIMVLAFASILAVESNSINATTRAKEMNIVAMLARNQMIELEYKVEGKTFEEVKKTEGGTFPPPYEGYRWQTEVKEIKFPNLNVGGGGKGGSSSSSSSSNSSSSSGGAGEQDANQYAEMITKMVTEYFTKAIREIGVTIYWKRGKSEASYSVSTYWVDLNHEFQPTL
jgi:type II secretion system protein I